MIKLSSIPQEPGCYLFKDKSGKIIYVGKAKNLKKRVSNYFQKKDHDAKTTMLVSNIAEIDFIVTKNDTEALLLENNLIKKHYPKYNIDLKDSRRYAYLRLTSEEFPRIEVARDNSLPGEYYGPFVSGFVRKAIEEVLNRQFKILNYKPSKRKLSTLDKEKYSKNLEKGRRVLKGEVKELIKTLQIEMNRAGENQQFEYALSIRNQIEALDHLNDKQIVQVKRSYDADVISYIIANGHVFLLVFNLYKGTLENKEQFEFEYYDGFFEEFLIQYYSEKKPPKEIIVPEEMDPEMAIFLSKKRGSHVTIIKPEKGIKNELLKLAKKNIEVSFFSEEEKLKDLQKIIGLDKLPIVMECFDISHLRGTDTVASMVQFNYGKPSKDNYRKYNIRTHTNGDDYAAMQEVVRRRYNKILHYNESMPDLIVIDGGKGQLSAATKILDQLGVSVPIISIAKKFEEIYLPGKKDPIKVSLKRKGLQLVQAIRDEAHRFAISFNRFKRKGGLLK